jgi:hypothetical protein
MCGHSRRDQVLIMPFKSEFDFVHRVLEASMMPFELNLLGLISSLYLALLWTM